MITLVDRPYSQRESTTNTEIHNEMGDADLIKLVLAGQRDAFPLLINRYQLMVRGILQSKLRDHSRVDDVFQSTVLKCFANLNQFRFASGFGTWFTQVALNEMRQNTRKERTREKHQRAYYFETSRSASTELVTKRLIEREKLSFVYAALQELPPLYRDAMILRYVQGLTVMETTKRLNLPVSTVKTRLWRGLQMTTKKVRTSLDRGAD